jgi:hypothetical protein
MFRWATSPWLVFSVAFAVRVPLIWARMHHPGVGNMFPENAAIARSFLSGHGYSAAFPGATVPTAWFAPGFTFFLVFLFKHFAAVTCARIALTLNLLFSSATAVGILFVGKALGELRAGAIGAWIWALWYYCAVFPLMPTDTSFSAFLMVAGVWGLLRVEQSRHAWQWVAFGFFWGLCCLVSPSFFSVLALFWVYLYMRPLQKSEVWRPGIVISILAFAMTIAPWTIRNYLTFGKFVFVRSDLPAEVYYANHKGLGDAPADYSSFPGANASEYQTLGEPAYMAEKKALFLDFLREQPVEFARRTLRRIYAFWTTPPGVGMWLVSACAFLGLGLAIKRLGARALSLAIPMIFFPVVYYLVYAFPKHRHPIDPVIVLLFAYALDWLLEHSPLGAVLHGRHEAL